MDWPIRFWGLKMSDVSEESGKGKKKVHPAIMVDREAFLSALGLTSALIQAMGDELEDLRGADHLPKDLRKALMQVVDVHLQNVAVISATFQLSIHDPSNPDIHKDRELN